MLTANPIEAEAGSKFLRRHFVNCSIAQLPLENSRLAFEPKSRFGVTRLVESVVLNDQPSSKSNSNTLVDRTPHISASSLTSRCPVIDLNQPLAENRALSLNDRQKTIQ